ncbi:MAG TPA: hypothetical protein VGE01_00910 [Fimbriimonas sp.]
MSWALILLILLIAGILAFLASARRGAAARAEDAAESMDADSRSLYSPIRRLSDEIEALASRKDTATIRIIGAEAAQEARRIREQCARALVARSELKRAGRGKSTALGEIDDLDRQLAEAASDQEKQAYLNAQEAYRRQIAHFAKAEEALSRIDVSVKAAEAVLAEMKTRLAVAASSEKAELAGDEDLRETISRMKTLSVSYDEAEQTLRSTF